MGKISSQISKFSAAFFKKWRKNVFFLVFKLIHASQDHKRWCVWKPWSKKTLEILQEYSFGPQNSFYEHLKSRSSVKSFLEIFENNSSSKCWDFTWDFAHFGLSYSTLETRKNFSWCQNWMFKVSRKSSAIKAFKRIYFCGRATHRSKTFRGFFDFFFWKRQRRDTFLNLTPLSEDLSTPLA